MLHDTVRTCLCQVEKSFTLHSIRFLQIRVSFGCCENQWLRRIQVSYKHMIAKS